MNKKIKFLLAALMGIALVSCTPEDTQTEFYLSNLQGEWVEDGTTHHVRFTTEQADETAYFWGCEWGVDDVEETDLIYHGNGWFKYTLEIKGDLHEIHMMDNDGADIPKEYIVTLLTDTKLTYREKGYNKKFHFTKQ